MHVCSYMYLLQSIWLSVGREIAADGGQEKYQNRSVLGPRDKGERGRETSRKGEVRSSQEDGEEGKKREEAMEESNAKIRKVA